MGEPIDDISLDEELEQMQQEQLDEQMLKSGTVPVSDAIHRMPAAANGESKCPPESKGAGVPELTTPSVKGATPAAKTAPQAEDDEEEELRKLQAEMAM